MWQWVENQIELPVLPGPEIQLATVVTFIDLVRNSWQVGVLGYYVVH